MNDYQRSKVYAWENELLGKWSKRLITIGEAQCFIDGVFMALGLLYPPKVRPKAKHERLTWAKANRLEIYMPPELPAWVLLHELAHSLNKGFGCNSDDAHGPRFMGIYLKLLDLVLNVPLCMLEYSLQGKGIDYDLSATPSVDSAC